MKVQLPRGPREAARGWTGNGTENVGMERRNAAGYGLVVGRAFDSNGDWRMDR